MTRYVDLDEYFAVAAEQLGLDTLTVLRLSRVDLAESAINSPRAEFASVEFYPTLPAKVAVLLSRLVRNHPLPDGNKRAALLTAILFAHRNGFRWQPPTADKDTDGQETFAVMLAIAQGSVAEDDLADWVSDRLVSE